MKSLLVLQCICLMVVFVTASPPFLPRPGDPQDNLSENCRIPECPEVKAVGNREVTVTLPYPLDCLEYVLCKGSQVSVLPCPPDLVFDKNTGICNERSKANCVPCA